MAARLAHRPARYTGFPPSRRLRFPCSNEDPTAVIACGRNMAPYWLLDSPYEPADVKMVLAAGKVTRTMPWTRPAAYTAWLWVRVPAP